MRPESRRRVRMVDIASRAGVHVTTVSLALRDHPRIPDATRRRIRKIAERMGFGPDAMLQALVAHRGRVTRSRNTPTLAYVTNWTSRFGWKNVEAHPDFHLGAQSKAAELGFKLEHFWLREPDMNPARLGRMLYARGIRGVIIASHAMEMGDSLQLNWENFSAVKIEYFPHEPALNVIANNQRDHVRLAIQNAVRLGYRRIGFVMHAGWDLAADHLWTAGCLCEQQHMNPADRIPAHLFTGRFPLQSWFNEGDVPAGVEPAAFRKWYQTYRPEVIISKAAFVVPEFNKMGVHIPKDVAFVDVFLGASARGVAGVVQKHYTVGETAVEILAGQLQRYQFGVPEIQTSTYIDGEWVDGESCPRRPPTSDHIWAPGWDEASTPKKAPGLRRRRKARQRK